MAADRSTAGAAVEAIADRLASAGDRSRAVGQRAYLKSERPFHGCDVPTVRRIAGAAVREFDLTTRDVLDPVVEALWDGVPFEHRAVAVELLADRHRLLDVRDLGWLRRWIADGETWALVDKLSTDVVGAIVSRSPAECEPTLDRWSTDDAFWVRRAALLALLPALRDGDERWPQFCRYAESLLGDREFFIRKAIGWVVREVARRRPDTARPWVAANLAAMSGVTRREATKYL